MVTIDHFVRGWRNLYWTSLPGNTVSFADRGTLLIGMADDEMTKCNVAWLDVVEQCWCITALPFVKGVLENASVEVRGAQSTFLRNVKLWIENDKLKGYLLLPGQSIGDGPVGTFTAEANIGEGGVDVTRLEERAAAS